MDGVIVDVSGSYREVVRQTARLFFNGIGSENTLPEPLFSLADLASVKQAGGLNNDWELTYHVLSLLMTKIKTPSEIPISDGFDGLDNLISRCNAEGLAAYLKSSPTPLTDLDKQHSAKVNAWINHLSTGDVGSGNVIKQIFQELYLGGGTFSVKPMVLQLKSIAARASLTRNPFLFRPRPLTVWLKHTSWAWPPGARARKLSTRLTDLICRRFFSITYTLDECLDEGDWQEQVCNNVLKR